ncbi:hypothetical protein C8J57DRAFT_1227981 [Mycena rebaudengoi]|nr:hypothetical protein C8J57DRAFT_1227981 [Mycena rebaudengoi]
MTHSEPGWHSTPIKAVLARLPCNRLSLLPPTTRTIVRLLFPLGTSLSRSWRRYRPPFRGRSTACPSTTITLPFDLLPPKIQSFLFSHGLADRAHYDPAAVASVRLWLTDKLLDTVNRICEAIVLVIIRYSLLRTMYLAGYVFLTLLTHLLHRELIPELERHMGEHLVYADALVWADVAACEGSLEARSLVEP